LTEITYNGSNVLIICRQKPTTHIISTFETLYVISVKYRLTVPDDGSYVIRNMLE